MICSLNCFCDFLEAKTPEGQAAVVRRYKRNTTEASKGMMIYYSPALRLIRGKLCPNGSLDEKLAALRGACIIASWTDKLNDARIASNTRVFKAFRSVFGNRKLKILSSPRMQYLASTDVAVNLQPELYVEVDGALMMWKFGMCKDTRPDRVIGIILQVMEKAARHKGLALSLEQMGYLDTVTGKTYIERTPNPKLESELEPSVSSLVRVWERAA
ncbi:MAG TPA: hypothetical protein VII58_11255 [Acidobacteriaceae bacterium]